MEWNSTCFGQFLCPLSEVFHCTHSNGIRHTGLLTACEQDLVLLESCLQTSMTYNIAVCTVKIFWWWTEELSKTCRVSFQNKFEKLVHLFCSIIRISYKSYMVLITTYKTTKKKISALFSREDIYRLNVILNIDGIFLPVDSNDRVVNVKEIPCVFC